jgi:Domain of unknown function (DUF4157)
MRSQHTTRTLAPPSREKQPFDPSVVHRALQTPGHALDDATMATMGNRFGRDFSQVRVHDDAVAARSARALDADGYAVGSDVVLRSYDPHGAHGSRLLAHELAHVTQHDRQAPASALQLGDPQSEAEREATRAADGDAGARASGSGTVGVVHRSLVGGLVGGLTGAAGGALLGGVLGGPIGAIVGGVVGLIGGAMAGNAATTDSRALTATEIAYAREVFRDTVDYSEIRITRDSMYSVGAPLTIGNTIHLKSSWGHFQGDGLDLTDVGRETLIHEMAHVWQYQNGGLAYIPLSLIAQFGAYRSGGDRGDAYDWREADRQGKPWEQWNPEQQAEAVEDYNKLLRLAKEGTATVEQLADLAKLVGYMQNVWERRGAPTIDLAPPADSPI